MILSFPFLNTYLFYVKWVITTRHEQLPCKYNISCWECLKCVYRAWWWICNKLLLLCFWISMLLVNIIKVMCLIAPSILPSSGIVSGLKHLIAEEDVFWYYRVLKAWVFLLCHKIISTYWQIQEFCLSRSIHLCKLSNLKIFGN